MDPEPDVAPEAPAEAPAEQPAFLTEDAFAEVARQRMAEHFAPPAEETPAAPEPDAQVEDQPEPEVRRNAAGRAIDEQGKYIAEPGSDEQVDTSAAEAKYASPEEAYRAATEAQRIIDESRTKISEMTARQQALEAQMAALQSGVNERLTVSGPELDDMIDENPARAAQIAYNQGDGDRLEAAVDAWKVDEPYEAAVFMAGVQYEYRDWQRRQAESAAREQAAPEPVAQNGEQPSAEMTPDDVQELTAVVLARPDLPKLMEAHGAAALAEHPLLATALRYGQPAQKAEALTILYNQVKARHVGAVTADAEQQNAVTQAEKAAQARADAQLVSASQGSAGTVTPAFADTVRTGFIEAARAQGHMARKQ